MFRLENVIRLRRVFLRNKTTVINDLRVPLYNNLCEEYEVKSYDKCRRLTKLDNGLNVASVDGFGMQATIGVVVKAGLRYEDKYVPGISNVVEKLSFKTTSKFPNTDAIQERIESHNGIFDCQAARDFLIYATSGSRDNISVYLDVLKETTLRPKISENDLEMAKKAIMNENMAMSLNPPPDNLISDLTHMTAFGDRGLGNPRYCPLDNLDKIKISDVYNYLGEFYRPENFYILGVGVDHDSMVEAVKEQFTPWNPIFDQKKEVQVHSFEYVGGIRTDVRDLTQYHAPMPEFGHISLSFKSDGTSNVLDYVNLCLFTSFMGGGGSFSSGGPGKGMYSRLYTNFLNKHHWVNSAQASNTTFSNVSLLSITGSAFPQDLNVLVSSVIVELQNILHNGIKSDELARAKTQLISMILMNLEMKPVVFEDFARQLINNGQPTEPEFWVDKINKVSEEELIDYLKRMMVSNEPTLIGFGKCENFINKEELIDCVGAAVDNKFIRKYVPNFLKKYF